MSVEKHGVDVSVVLATRDRAESLNRTLNALAEQETGSLTWEVIVVDNGSSDSTATVIEHASKVLPVVAAFEPLPGKNRAVNRGVSLARGQLILFTDDDVDPARDWMKRLVEAASRWPEDNIFGGRIFPRFPAAAPAWMTAGEFPYGRWAFSAYSPRPDEGLTSETPLGPNMAIRASCLAKVVFDESIGPCGPDYAMGSEVELLLRLYRSGEQFVYVPDAVVGHVVRPEDITRHVLVRRAYRCGRGNARLFPTVGAFPVFGIPLHQWERGVKALIGVILSLVGSRRDRLIAWMTFHQVRGNLHERRVARRKASSGTGERFGGLFPTVGALAGAIRRRGLVGVFTSPLVWILRPFVRYERIQVFEGDVGLPRPGGSGPTEVTIEVHKGSESVRDVCALLGRLEAIKPEDVELRLKRGDWVAIARVDSEPVGFAWSGFTEHWVRGIEAPLRVAAGEMVGYDGFVQPLWRGRRIISDLDATMLERAAELGYRRQWVYARTADRFAVRSLETMGKRKVFTAAAVSFPILGKRIGPSALADPGHSEGARS